jgi:hypothetical protein
MTDSEQAEQMAERLMNMIRHSQSSIEAGVTCDEDTRSGGYWFDVMAGGHTFAVLVVAVGT